MQFSAEEQMIRSLEKMQGAATDIRLQQVFQSHHQETETHADRLRRVLLHTGGGIDEVKCKAASGLIQEEKDLIEECDSTVRDVALIGAAQRIEHYGIAMYGALRNFAQALDFTGDAEVFDRILHEQVHANRVLKEISDPINHEAMKLP
jgi:ferritin-like metal-binding protein YciE